MSGADGPAPYIRVPAIQKHQAEAVCHGHPLTVAPLRLMGTETRKQSAASMARSCRQPDMARNRSAPAGRPRSRDLSPAAKRLRVSVRLSSNMMGFGKEAGQRLQTHPLPDGQGNRSVPYELLHARRPTACLCSIFMKPRQVRRGAPLRNNLA